MLERQREQEKKESLDLLEQNVFLLTFAGMLLTIS